MQQAPSQSRLSNLVDIEVDKNLIKPAGLHMPCWLVFPHYDVTNRVDLKFQFDQPLADLIDETFMPSDQPCRLPSIKVKLIDQSNTQRADSRPAIELKKLAKAPAGQKVGRGRSAHWPPHDDREPTLTGPSGSSSSSS